MQVDINNSHKIITRNYVVLRNLAFINMLGFLVYHWFPFPPVVWRLGLVALSVIGLIIHVRYHTFTAIEKTVLGFVVLNIVYFFISFLWQTPEYTNFGNVLCATLPLFLFYLLAFKGAITQRSLTFFLLLSIVLGYFFFAHAEDVLLERWFYGEAGDMTVNASTIFLVIIPLLFFQKNRWFVLGVAAVIVFFVIYGAKRGNIVSMVVPLYFLFRASMKSKKNWVSEALVILGFAFLAFFAYRVMTGSDYLMHRIEETIEGDSSGRDEIYAAAFNTWLNSGHLYNSICGFGTDGTIHLIGVRAHNDWLEILVDFGLLGVIIYLFFFVRLFRVAWHNKMNQKAFYALMAVFVIWFTKSLYSMGFTENLFSYLSMVIGIVLGELDRPEEHRNLLA